MIGDWTIVGRPDSITCRWCGETRHVQRSMGDVVHRMCLTCDAPGRGLLATWLGVWQ